MKPGQGFLPANYGLTRTRIALITFSLSCLLLLPQFYLPLVRDNAPALVSRISFGKGTWSTQRIIDSEADPETLDLDLDASEHTRPQCATGGAAKDILVIMKTGATELYGKLPEQLLTTLSCIPNVMLVSDLEQDVAGFHVYDVIEGVSDEYKATHQDFVFYRKLKEYQRRHQDVSSLKSEAGWNLDKWKFIPMVYKAREVHPHARWYVFIEADAYLGWPNLVELLGRLDADEPYYLGASFMYGDTEFAQGGGGFAISKAAAEAFESARNDENIAKWDLETSENCCGDVVLASAMYDAGVNVTGGWPFFQTDPPEEIYWGDQVMCSPAVSFHHVKPHDVAALWEFEQAWAAEHEDPAATYTNRDLFDYLVKPHLAERRSRWDNLSRHRVFTGPTGEHGDEDRRYGNDTRWDELTDEERQQEWDALSETQQASIGSVEACRSACEAQENCIQYSFRPGKCSLGEEMRFGRAYNGKGSKRVKSGWMMDRVDAWYERDRDCVASWKVPT